MPFLELGRDGAGVHHVGVRVWEMDRGQGVGGSGRIGVEPEGFHGWGYGGKFHPLGFVGEGFVIED